MASLSERLVLFYARGIIPANSWLSLEFCGNVRLILILQAVWLARRGVEPTQA